MAELTRKCSNLNEDPDCLNEKRILGEVHKGTLNGKDVAVKVINTRNRDLSVLNKVLTNANIIAIMAYEYREKESTIYISMELLDQNTDQYIAAKQLLDVQIEDILRQCAAGICFLHDNNEVHRRIKPSNFLIQIKDRDNIIVKAADWFLEKTQEDSDVYSHWFAPEESTTNPVMANEIGYKMNVFSFAILVMHVGAKEGGREHIRNNTRIGEDVYNEKNVLEDFSISWQSMSFRDFIVPLLIKTLDLDPEMRPTMKTVCQFLERKLTYPQLRLDKIVKNIISREGSFGMIYRGEYDGQVVAIKTINKHRIDISRQQKILTSETIILMKKLRHPNVVQLLVCEDKTPNNLAEIWIGMELCDWSLDKYLAKNPPDEKETRSILRQCASGLLYLHDNHLSHRDFKPNNILIKREGDNKIVKITDFSLTKDIEGHESTTMTSVHGNPHWLTPEQMTDTFDKLQEFEYKGSEIFPVDVFQYALVLIYICIKQEERDKMFKTIYIGRDVKMGKTVLDYFASHWNHENLRFHLEPLLTKILISDPQRRPTMHEVIEFFQPCKISTTLPVMTKTLISDPQQRPTMHEVMELFQPRKISTTLPVLTHITSHNFCFSAHSYVGISPNDNCVLLGRDGSLFNKRGTLLLYQLQDNEIKQLWEKQSPEGVTWEDRKYIRGHEKDLLLTTRYNDQNPTLCHDSELRRQHEHRVGEGMYLIGVLPGTGHRMVYTEITTDDCQVHIYAGDSRVLSLQPPPGIHWDGSLSLCHEERSGWFAVNDFDSSLCIYDAAGTLQHHVSLTYRPDWWNGVTCTRHHILVSQSYSTTVHIHAWDGRHLGSVNLKDKVKLGEGEDHVQAVGVCDGGCSLIVATGPDCVTSLHALKVQ